MRALLLVLILGGLLAAVIVGAIAAWLRWDDAELSLHGWLALGFGIVVSLALGVGLMSLTFLSSRRGHDDEAGR